MYITLVVVWWWYYGTCGSFFRFSPSSAHSFTQQSTLEAKSNTICCCRVGTLRPCRYTNVLQYPFLYIPSIHCRISSKLELMQQHLRVASLLPSATDTVVALGCASWVVARSHEVGHALRNGTCRCIAYQHGHPISAQCDDQTVAAAPIVTSSKLGDVPTLHDADESMVGAHAFVYTVAEAQRCHPLHSNKCPYRLVHLAHCVAWQRLQHRQQTSYHSSHTVCATAPNHTFAHNPRPTHMLLSANTTYCTGLAVYQVDLEALHRLKPDVILTQIQDMCPEDAQEHAQPHASTTPTSTTTPAATAGPGPSSQRVARVQAALHMLWGYTPTVVHLAASCLQECWQDMTAIATALQQPQQGSTCIHALQQQMQWVQDACRGRHHPPVVCVQWPDPWYAAGSWVPECVQAAGGRDVLGRVEHAVAFDLQQLATTGAQVLVFAICGMDLAASVQHVRGCMQQLVQHCGELPAIKYAEWGW